ncbi:MAG TPA: glutamate--cysteine ligase [Steroidobacteraceae bacterium]|jgi:glutamate--cysteine ligase|nr:glutamate--cysteine ligase [Steroidobacteraceae bacterium]
MGRNRVDRAFERRLSGLVNARERGVLSGGLKGVEREALRVTPDGRISQKPHPRALGSALTHPNITTDYSEALIELVTPPFPSAWELQQYLCDIHQFVYSELGDEFLWATSMPCAIGGDAEIPIAEYGTSNIGRMKHVYRVGLGLRYGRMMQAISGIHYNYSFPARLWPVLEAVTASKLRGQALVDDAYFALLRNYRRFGWIILFLFGVSPAMCRSFFAGREIPGGLEARGGGTLVAPYSTSLRMSDLGYRNKSQAGVYVSVNSLEEYVRDLSRLISTPHPEYEAQGVEVDGEWRQLNANLLQIENEYYSFIRPKRVAYSGERPTRALQRAGVQYVEMRSLDVGAYDPVGVNQRKLLFLEAFAALCLLRDSPPLAREQSGRYEANHVLVASRGREPGLELWNEPAPLLLADWAAEVLDQMQGICELLDSGDASRPYSAALAFQRAKLVDFGELPSARLLDEMRRQGMSFYDVGLWMSRMHRDYFRELYPPNPGRLAELRANAAASLEEQRAVEARDTLPFAEFVARYTAGSLV